MEKFAPLHLCDFEVHLLGTVQRHTVQCMLPINVLASRLLLLLSIWYYIGLLLSVVSLVYWLLALFIPYFQRRFIHSYALASDPNMDKHYYARSFVSGYIHTDGVLFLKMVQENVGEVSTQELVSSLWENYQHTQAEYLLAPTAPTYK